MINEQLEKIKGKINFSNFKIDVGTAFEAPNSAHWLLREKDVYVLGIEPNVTNTNILKRGSSRNKKLNYLRLEDSSILMEGKIVSKFDPERFSLLEQVAIDNVNGLEKKKFYCTSDICTGCSSLLKPTENLSIPVERIDEVEVVSLEYILDYINFPADGYIRFVKTDTQAKDLDVVKSLRKYLKKVVALKCEYNTMNQYENETDPKKFVSFMKENNFKLVGYTPHDFLFYNNLFSPEELFNLPEEI